MKRTILYTLYTYIGALLVTSCVADLEPLPKGWLQIERPVKDSVTETRAADEIDYLVSIKRGENQVFSPVRFSTINGPIPLSPGDYTLMAESCTKIDAQIGYGQPRYAGAKGFTIIANTEVKDTVFCAMANAAFQVLKDTSFYYTSYTVTATVNSRSLQFTDEEQMGYFNVGDDGTATLSYQVIAKDSNGKTGTGNGTLQLKAKTLSRLQLCASTMGNIDVNITYDDTFTPIITNVPINP